MLSWMLITCFLFPLIVHINCDRIRYTCHVERTVENLDLIQHPNGVPLDFRYNETSSKSSNSLASAPGCPKSIDGYPWLYFSRWGSSFKKGTRCYLAGSQGPCPFGQVLFVQAGSTYGICGCECLLNKLTSWDAQQKSQRYQRCASALLPEGQVYDKMDKRICFNLLEQGPCQSGSVLAEVLIGWNFEIRCLQSCNFTDPNWHLKQANGECAGGGGGGGGFAANLPSNQCPEEERFSVVLKKCIKRQPHTTLVLG